MRSNPWKCHVWSTWLEDEELCQAINFATVSQEGPTCEGPMKVFVWQKVVFALPILYPHYIYPHYPQIVMSVFQRENPSIHTWELEIVIPTIIYTFLCGFPPLLSLHIQILERMIAQTLTTPNLRVKWGFGDVGKNWKKPIVGGCNQAELHVPGKLEKTRLRQVRW